MEGWQHHARAGRFIEELNKEYIDKDGSLMWLRTGQMGYGHERLIIAAQDQGLLTKGFKKMAGIRTMISADFAIRPLNVPAS